MTLSELAETSGLPARTIRFYVARGLLDGPIKSGRGAAYAAEHLERLNQIRKLQDDGRTLAEIAGAIGGLPPESAAEGTPWSQYVIADDVIVWARSDVSPWRTKQVRLAISEFARRVQPAKDGKGKKEATT